ncbi:MULTISPECIES: preprotein translocase subunit SecE [unclassified Wenzhouxiangella]|uniref:preprotein translocase subunit SecE n=1 Tax=unclassified Wenzhouxiangella TaxID=2613841 RepID=UPI000E329718|nr:MULTISPECIES: preprotein translocase subunit SecE [unclassified Wenzhouxiangella]RFF26901.1 preprotein translocase subunit SecE [Wenzhouxiangella sp. 15181]RFP67501.1 preprotein translocase subunit SecE [Wenzhouxiangella sp. 15190]
MAAEKTSARDYLFWSIGLLIVAAGLYGFYQFAGEVITPIRAAGLLVSIVIAAFVVAQTVRGREFFSFLREADVERRKVVWPTRNETMQTTLVVIVLTIIASILLFIMDTIFGWVVRQLIGSGGS